MRRVLITLIMVAVLVGLVFAPATTVMAASATRTLPLSGIAAAGENFVVDISVSGFGAFGQVVEELPPGFSYVSCDDLSEVAVEVAGQEVKFTLLAEDTAFSYTVKASSSAGTYSFGGILKDEDKGEYVLGGNTQIIVPATRSLPSSVTANANFNVSISTFDFGAFGQVVETLPSGFSYVSSTLSAVAVDVAGQVVKFTLLAEDTAFSYTVKASSAEGTYTFSGILKDVDKVEYDIGGQAQITVTHEPTDEEDVGVGAPAVTYAETDLFGTEARFQISDEGEILKTIEATSEDGNLTVTIAKGTIALDKDGDPLDSLEAVVDESPPDPPEDAHIIGLTYDFGPAGATFDPAIPLTWSYDPDEIPSGVTEEDLVIAYYDGAEWVELDCVIDTKNNIVTALVDHFSKYAIIARTAPTPAPATFSASSLSVLPAEVEPSDAVTITVSVANTGDESGSYILVLKLNEVKEAQKTAIIAAGSSLDVSFTVTREELGSYTVTIAGLSASFTVAVPPEEEEEVVEEVAVVEEEEELLIPAPPTNWALIGGIVVAVIAVIFIVSFLLVRRRRAT